MIVSFKLVFSQIRKSKTANIFFVFSKINDVQFYHCDLKNIAYTIFPIINIQPLGRLLMPFYVYSPIKSPNFFSLFFFFFFLFFSCSIQTGVTHKHTLLESSNFHWIHHIKYYYDHISHNKLSSIRSPNHITSFPLHCCERTLNAIQV